MMINAVGYAGQALPAQAKTAVAEQAPAVVTLPTPAVDEARLKHAIREANHAARTLSSSIEFSVDLDSGRTVVKVVDSNTQQLIRQMPSEEMMEISLALDRMQGMLLKRKA